jgi:PAT family beta-lactamase induction signal transducer AmpG
MGRWRVWIVGAQIALVAMLIVAAILSPLPDEIVLLTGLGFLVNLPVVLQEVGVDSLAIDIMQQDERPVAVGVMFGAPTFGIAITTGLSGWLLSRYGFTIAIASLVLLPTATILFGLAISERDGERNLPSEQGASPYSQCECTSKKLADAAHRFVSGDACDGLSIPHPLASDSGNTSWLPLR